MLKRAHMQPARVVEIVSTHCFLNDLGRQNTVFTRLMVALIQALDSGENALAFKIR